MHIAVLILLFTVKEMGPESTARYVVDALTFLQFALAFIVFTSWTFIIWTKDKAPLTIFSIAKKARDGSTEFQKLRYVDLTFVAIQIVFINFYLSGMGSYLISLVLLELATVYKLTVIRDILDDRITV